MKIPKTVQLNYGDSPGNRNLIDAINGNMRAIVSYLRHLNIPVPDSAGVYETLQVGDTKQLTPISATPSDATITYTSSDTAIATVNSGGLVTAVAAGEVTITITGAKSGSVDGTVDIDFVIIPSTQVKLEIPATILELFLANNMDTIVDKYGINPAFVRMYPNKCWNSGFEGFNPVNLKPHYWSAGVVSPVATFNGNFSLKLTNGQACQQEQVAGVGMADPAWWSEFSPYTRVAFKAKGGPVTVSVHKLSDNSTLTLTDENGTIGTSITYASASDWSVGHRTFRVDTSVTPGKIYVKFTAGGTVYIDDVDITPDFTGKWPMLYQDGPKSLGVGAVSFNPVTGGVVLIHPVGVIPVVIFNNAYDVPVGKSTFTLVS